MDAESAEGNQKMKYEEAAMNMAAIFKERGQPGILREGKTGKEHAVTLISEDDTTIKVKAFAAGGGRIRRILKWSMQHIDGATPRHGDIVAVGGEEHPLNGVAANAVDGRAFLHYLTSDRILELDGNQAAEL